MMVVAVLLLVLASLGLGAGLLRLCGLLQKLKPGEAWSWSFALGVGVLGWLLFGFAGLYQLQPQTVWPLLCVSALGCWLLPWPSSPGWRPWFWVAPVSLAGVSVCVIWVPPVDGDSLTYHFALAKQMAQSGGLVFVPRAVDGAAPLLIQIVYAAALSLGGEKAMVAWQIVCYLALPVLLYTSAADWLGEKSRLYLALLVATVPAVLYGGWSGQIEVKLAFPATVAMLALCRGVAERSWRWFAVVGLATGIYAGAKLTGLLFAASVFVIAAIYRAGWRSLAGLVLCGAIMGGQWYLFYWHQTGDPFFPVLWPLLGGDGDIWDMAQHAHFRQALQAGEVHVPANAWWSLAYPFVATFDGLPKWESGRTGFGPLPVLVLPFAFLAAWGRWRQTASHMLVPALLVAVLFYFAWFFSASSQRVRHLLPLLPMAALLAAVALQSAWRCHPEIRGALAVLLACGLALHVGGMAVYARPFVLQALVGHDRDRFLGVSVANYQVVEWINANLGQTDKLVHGERQLNYYLDVPYIFAHPDFQKEIPLRPDQNMAPQDFLRILGVRGVTHALLIPGLEAGTPGVLGEQMRRLVAMGCARVVHRQPVSYYTSRTLLAGRTDMTADVVAIKAKDCARE